AAVQGTALVAALEEIAGRSAGHSPCGLQQCPPLDDLLLVLHRLQAAAHKALGFLQSIAHAQRRRRRQLCLPIVVAPFGQLGASGGSSSIDGQCLGGQRTARTRTSSGFGRQAMGIAACIGHGTGYKPPSLLLLLSRGVEIGGGGTGTGGGGGGGGSSLGMWKVLIRLCCSDSSRRLGSCSKIGMAVKPLLS
ncbi:hypothetical protein M5D96_005512, partial [Drosophila gunungcola]